MKCWMKCPRIFQILKVNTVNSVFFQYDGLDAHSQTENPWKPRNNSGRGIVQAGIPQFGCLVFGEAHGAKPVRLHL